MLSAADLSRYNRQLVLPEVGIAGQERLGAARVLVVGAGGLGSPASLYLAAAGVGTLGIIDDDTVEVSNLHRQILHGARDVGRRKTESAAESVGRLNPTIQVRTHTERLDLDLALAIFPEYDVVVDGSDNYRTRYAINDASARLDKLWIYGSVERFSGQVSVFGAADGPCYRCVFPEAPAPGATPSCEDVGVLGAVPGVIGALQAVEALKCLLGVGEPLIGRLLQLDFDSMTTQIIGFDRAEGCAGCALRSDVRQALPYERLVDPNIQPTELERLLDEPASDFQLLDIREPWEWSLCHIGKPQFLQMGDLERQLDSVDKRRDLIVYCHHGTRSGVAVDWLRARGFPARNLVGGIDRWSREIDSSVPRY